MSRTSGRRDYLVGPGESLWSAEDMQLPGAEFQLLAGGRESAGAFTLMKIRRRRRRDPLHLLPRRVRPQPRPQYAASKAAINHLAALLARELGRDDIRVNTLSPGSIAKGTNRDVRLRGHLTEEEFAAFVAREFPLGRLGTLAEVADTVAFLLSKRASWISGTNIAVDGAQLQSTVEGY